MSGARFLLEHGAALLLIAASAAALGRSLTASLPFSASLERWSFTTAIGLGVLASVVHLLGLVGAIRPAPILALLAGPFLVRLAPAMRHSYSARAPDRIDRRLAVVLLLGLGPALVLALYPPTEFDSTMYHLPYAKAFAALHATAFLPTLRFPVFPQLVEMLFAAALSVSDDVTAQLIHFLCLAATAAAVAAWGRHAATERAGAWAAAAFLGNPIVLAEGASAYVDVGLALFATLCLYAWSNGEETNDRRWFIWSAVLAGFAAAAKYHGLFFVFAIPAALWIRRSSPGRRLAPAYLAVALLVLSPFYARIVANTGNPVFPFLPDVFGDNAWAHAMHPESSAGSSPGALGRLRSAAPLARAVGDLFLPGDVRPRKSTYSPLLLLLPPLLVLAAVGDRRRRPLLAVMLAYGAAWYALNPAPRYLLPVLPAAAVLAAAAADRALRARGIPRRVPESAFATAVALLLVLPGTAWAGRKIWRQGPLPTTDAARESYLDRRVSVHASVSALNASLGRRYTVYCLQCENAAYFAEGTFLGDHFGPYRFSRVEAALNDGRRLFATLREMGATHLIVSHERGTVSLPDDPEFRRLFAPLPAPPGVSLFALRLETSPSLETQTPVSSAPTPKNP